jgi:hypothetical protein
MRCCARADIPTETLGTDGRAVEHVDLHSLRRTFATNLIAGGADPKSVQELLEHSTLDMTMRIYAKANPQNKRQALGQLSYGQGPLPPSTWCPILAWAGKRGRMVTHWSPTGGMARKNRPKSLRCSDAGVAEWQTRRIQNPVYASRCGFESHLRHNNLRRFTSGSTPENLER